MAIAIQENVQTKTSEFCLLNEHVVQCERYRSDLIPKWLRLDTSN